ncbi:MAG: 50S ribosomal protein L24 [Candidatus Micrarchaeia archaeon]
MPSIQPRKQRKARFAAPLHARHRLVAAHLSKEARQKLGTKRRSLPLRKGDRVKVLRGEHKGKTGKVARVSLSSLKAFVEGVVVKEAKGTEKLCPIDPSNLLILEADVADKQRAEVLGRSRK